MARVGPSNIDPATAAAGGYSSNLLTPAGVRGSDSQPWSASSPASTMDLPNSERDKLLQSQLMNSYNAAGSRTAPQTTASQAAQASQAGYQAAGSAGSSSYTPYTSERAPGAQGAQYNAYQAATAGPASTVDMTRLGQASLVGAPRINAVIADRVDVPWAERAGDVNVGYTEGPAAGQTNIPEWQAAAYAAGVMDINPAQIGEMQRAQASQVGQFDTGNSDQLRARQMELLDYLEGSAKGTNGPSAAEMQFQRNLDKSIAAQRAQAAGANGTGRVSANLQAGYNIGELSQDANAQSAMLRAQEQQQARAQLLAGLSDTRGQDITVGQAQQQVSIANANLQTAVSQFNAGQINQGQLQQAQMAQQAAIVSAQNRLSNNQFNANLQQNQQQFSQDIQARVGMSNAGLSTQANVANSQIQAARAQQQAQINSTQGMFNAGEENTNSRLQSQMDSNTNMFNAGQTNDVNKTQATLGLQAGTFNAGAQNSFQQQQAALNSSERMYNSGAENQMSQFNVGQQNNVGMANAQNQNQVGMFNAGQANSVNMFNTGQANQVGMANAQNSLQNSQFNIGQSNQLGMFNAGQFNNNSQFNAGQTNQGNQFNAGLQNQVNITNTDAMLRQRALDDANKQALMNQYLAASQLQQQAGEHEGNYALNKRGQNLGLAGNLLSQGGAIATKLISDERAKTDVKPLYSDERGKDKKKLLDSYAPGDSNDDVGRLLDNLTAYKFKYKDPSQPGTMPGERYGIMAQDLEKSPMGASIVTEEGGRKRIDTAQAVGVLMAAMVRQNQQIKKLEGRR